MSDYYEQMGYALPDDMPQSVTSEQKEYYKHPAGLYEGFIGRLNLKFKTADGKRAEQGTPGANLSHGILQMWITRYLGTPQTPVNVTIIKPDLTFDLRPTPELYYPQMVTFLPKDQWKNIKLFDKFTLGPPESRIIRPNADKPTIKETVFKNFAYYYGVPIKWEILSSDKGNTYINTAIEILPSARFAIPDMQALEKEFERLLEIERASRKEQKQEQYVPPTADIDLSDISADTLDGEGLPF